MDVEESYWYPNVRGSKANVDPVSCVILETRPMGNVKRNQKLCTNKNVKMYKMLTLFVWSSGFKVHYFWSTTVGFTYFKVSEDFIRLHHSPKTIL